MPDSHKNFAYALVVTAPSPADSGTSIVVTTGLGALFPTPPFNVTVWPANTQPLSTNAEILRVTNITGDTFTVTREQESTTARTIVAGDQIAATITAKTLTDAENGFTPPTGTGVATLTSGAFDAAARAIGAGASNSILDRAAGDARYLGIAANATSATLAASATALATPRNINGVAFDGTANITVPAAAGTLSGATLAAGVTASSLTSVGTLLNLSVTNTITGSISGNAATVTTNANLTGDVTSVGNATTLANIPALSGANLTSLNASNLSSGTVNHARLGSGGGGSTKYLREDSTWQTISGGGDALTTGTLDQFADVTQTGGATLAISASTTLAGGSHSGTNTGDQDLSGLVVKSANLSDLANAATARTNLGLGSLATQSGTFSGTSSGTNTGDQNTFSTVAVAGQSNVVADSAGDTLTLIAGTNVTITTNATNDEITINSSGGGVSDGDKGDIEVSIGGTVWTVESVDAGTVAAPTAVIKVKRKPGEITGSDGLAVGELGIDTTNYDLSFCPATSEIKTVALKDLTLDQFSGVSQDVAASLVINVTTTLNGGDHSGTNTGDQTITLTGDVTGTGTGSFAATIAASAVTYAKIQDVSATDKLLGRSTAGAGVVEEIACTAAGRAILDDVDASAQRTTLGLGSLATSSALTGDVTSSGSSTTLANIPAISGANLTSLNASNLSSGTVNHARLGSGGGGSTKFLREDATWQTVSGGSGAEKWEGNWDGQGAVITGDSVFKAVVATGTITSIALVSSVSGSVTVTAKKYTPSGGARGSPTTLGTASLSSADHSRTTGLSWSVTAGDVIEFVPSAITSVTRLHVTAST